MDQTNLLESEEKGLRISLENKQLNGIMIALFTYLKGCHRGIARDCDTER